MKLIRVVRSTEVDYATQQGWQLVRVIEGATRIESQREVEQDAYSNNQGHTPAKYKVFQATINDPLFVLEKDRDEASREDELIRKAQKLEADLIEAQKEVAALGKELVARTQQLETAKAEAEKRKEEAAQLLKRASEHAKTIEDMKAEATKIRRYIGDGRWSAIGLELLGGE